MPKRVGGFARLFVLQVLVAAAIGVLCGLALSDKLQGTPAPGAVAAEDCGCDF